MMPSDHTKSEGENFVKAADDILTEELRRLSFQDRNDITEEIHGVRVLAPEETPELLNRSLTELEVYLNEMTTEPPSLKIAYNLSQGLDLNNNNGHSSPSRTYVNDASFRLRFLRCEFFDAKKAALRIIKYLDFALELFGEYVLRRPIQLDDFSKQEMKMLRSGFMQLLPYRDRTGRPILAFVGQMGINYGALRLKNSKAKIMLYNLYVAGGDVESQRKGLVVIAWPTTHISLQRFSMDANSKAMNKRFMECTSIRVCTIHLCFPDTFLYRMFRHFFVGAVTSSVRPRLKSIAATGMKTTYELKGYGIPIELIPLTDTGNVKTAFLKQWIKLRLLLEREISPGVVDADNEGKHPSKNSVSLSSIVEFPGSCDVLYRTGTTNSLHPGNFVFRELIEFKLEEYQNLQEVSFSIMADQLINEILQIRKGRFLKWDNRGYWTLMNDRVQTNAKVKASIRDFKRLKEAKTNLQSVDSSTHIFVGQDMKRRKMSSDNNRFLRATPPNEDAAAEEQSCICSCDITPS